jgi:FkbM family methyltransferase
MMLADAVGPDGQVVALEAHPGDAATLQRNKELNDLPQLVCLHAAVARENGTVPFGRHGSVDDGSGRWGAEQVPAHSIDELARRYGPPDVVFVDVEGYELEALRGATETLAAGPDWFVEVHYPEQLAQYGASSLEVLACLQDAGYAISTLQDAGYMVMPDGRRQAIAAPQPLAETPPELLTRRFFALATRRAA